MTEKNTKKTKRNLYVPEFISEILDVEAEIHGGTGEVLAAAILSFYQQPNAAKKDIMKAYSDAVLEVRYSSESDVTALVGMLKSVRSNPKAPQKKASSAKPGKSAG